MIDDLAWMPCGVTVVKPTETALERAVALLAAGELVGLPTETVYGLAANATDAAAVAKIFVAKGRPSTNPLIVHVADRSRLAEVIDWPPTAEIRSQLDAVSGLWPGPLTVICPRAASIPDAVTAGRETVAVRIPNHPVALELLKRCPFPLAAPSANRSNYISPTRPEHVAEGLGEAVSLIFDGGPCEHGIESTIVALGSGGPRLLRPGAITAEDLAGRLGVPVLDSEPLRKPPQPLSRKAEQEGTSQLGAEAPGMTQRHYAPSTPLRILDQASVGSVRPRTGRLAFGPITDEEACRYAAVEVLSPTGDLREVAQGLFAALRRLDACDLDLIVSDRCPEEGIGRAVMDRLRRAARAPHRSNLTDPTSVQRGARFPGLGC